jgi:murein L,D-transpeptidase YafK
MKKYWIGVGLSAIFLVGCGKKVEAPKKEPVKVSENLAEEIVPELTVYDWQQNDELIKQGKATKMVVVKAKRVLVLFDEDGDVLSRHRVSLGENPIGTKLKMGDKKTPEGVYNIRDIRSDEKYYKEILISYPNKADIKRSKELGYNPGGGITFHAQVPWNWDGRGDDHTLANDWTNGCVAMTNYGMDTVLNMIDKDTIVEIRE